MHITLDELSHVALLRIILILFLFIVIPNFLHSQTVVPTTFNVNGTWTDPAGVTSVTVETRAFQ